MMRPDLRGRPGHQHPESFRYAHAALQPPPPVRDAVPRRGWRPRGFARSLPSHALTWQSPAQTFAGGNRDEEEDWRRRHATQAALLAGLGLDEVQELYPISPSRLSRAERDRADLSPAARAALERALSQEIRRRAKELNEFVRECDAEAEAVAEAVAV
jgi:hypothetical protein